MSNRDKILDKIKKCLALSASSNEHEAEAALRQARKLMESHGITDLEIQAAEAEERRAKSSVTAKPAAWENTLAHRIAEAFGCRLIFSPGYWARRAEWMFIGCGAMPEVAQYAFTVLLRQVKRARAEHIKVNLKRCKLATKTRRADLFCEGWVRAVTGKIAAFAGSEKQSIAIDTFVAVRYPELGSLVTTNRNDGRKLRDHEYGDLTAGGRAGRNAQLNRGVGGADQRLALE